MKLRVPMPRWFTAYGTLFMPFADAASPELPMARAPQGRSRLGQRLPQDDPRVD